MLLKQLDHVAFRVDACQPVVDFYTTQLGYIIVQEMELDLDGSKAASVVLQLPETPFFIFVDQGLEEHNIITKWVEKNGSGMHHMAYLVDDIKSVHKNLLDRGIHFTTDCIIDTGGGLKQLFSLPNPVTGLITEIIQRDRDHVFFVQGNVIKLIESTRHL